MDILENHPSILPQARDTLLRLLSDSLQSAKAQHPSSSSILSIPHYKKELLSEFIPNEQEKVTKFWEGYIARRRAGHPREMLKTHNEAKHWIRQAAPLKYVDGAWLGHLNKTSTPFALRRLTKDAWQIMSEECGDGDLEKHHAYIYGKLVRQVDESLSPGYTEDFIDSRHGLDDVTVWKASVAQLLISLFPHEFLPEILGFNLHFEGLSEETLVASQELKELKFDPSYFLLHISIDNADSGHTAMALQVVTNYMDFVEATMDEQELHRAWAGILAGFILSQSLSSEMSDASKNRSTSEDHDKASNYYGSAVEKIFHAKSRACHRIHCDSKTKIGGRTLHEWLSSEVMELHRWRLELLDSLSTTKTLVCRGQSGKSKFLRDITWGGKMFGAFTTSEVESVKNWIDAMPPLDQVYSDLVGQSPQTSTILFRNQIITSDYPVFRSCPLAKGNDAPAVEVCCRRSEVEPSLRTSVNINDINFTRLLPLWFAHPALLESFIVIPFKIANTFGYAALRFVRAQSGFDIESSGIAGKDEFCRPNKGLLELGLEMSRNFGLEEPTSLKDVLDKWPSEFAKEMLRVSMYSTKEAATLLGFASAFQNLHLLLAESDVLCHESRHVLRQIARREEENLSICLQELKGTGSWGVQFQVAYEGAIAEIEGCFASFTEHRRACN